MVAVTVVVALSSGERCSHDVSGGDLQARGGEGEDGPQQEGTPSVQVLTRHGDASVCVCGCVVPLTGSGHLPVL